MQKRVNAVKRLAVSTGPLRVLTTRTHPAYRPGGLPGAFTHKGRETSSCGGFHAYMPSAFILAERWLPSGAPSGTTGTPEVRPSQSSRTREKTAQVSYARTR